VHAVVFNLGAASALAQSGGGCIVWHSTIETTGDTAAEYRLWDNTINGGTRLMSVALRGGQSTRDYIKRCHLPFRVGLYYEVVSGSIEGELSILIDHDCHDYWRLVAEAEAVALAQVLGV